MANVIRPVGFSNIYDEAKFQDDERRSREAQEHFDRTGERLSDYREYDPLVPINGVAEPPDVADDGNSYADLGRLRDSGDGLATGSIRDAMDSMFGSDNSESISTRNKFRQEINEQERLASGREEILRAEEQKIQDEVFKLNKESKQRFNNAISGLELE